MKKYFLFYGAGNKAIGCDLNMREASVSLAKGIMLNGYGIIGYIDLSVDNKNIAIKNYGGQAYDELEKALIENKNANVIIATPDIFHYENIIEVLNHNVIGIFVEKPIAMNAKEAYYILSEVRKRKMKIEVNYFRRFLPSYIKIKKDIGTNKFGKILFGRGTYDKGLLHNGSHMINLLLFLFGVVEFKTVFGRNESQIKNDFNYSFLLSLPNQYEQNIVIQHGNSELYTMFELELYFEKKVIKFVDFGRKIKIYEPSEDIIPGYKNLVKVDDIQTEYMNSSYYSIKHYNANNTYIGIEDSCRTIEICEEIKKNYEDSYLCL